jgi:hypothetical protein
VATKVKGLKTTAGIVTDTIVMEPPAAAIKNSIEITNQASVPALAGSTVQKTRLKKMCALLEGAQGTGPQKRKPLKLIMMLLGGN